LRDLKHIDTETCSDNLLYVICKACICQHWRWHFR